MNDPATVLLFSGKRKSGKDYICEKIKAICGEERCSIIRISEPLKGLYAQNHNLNVQELMSDGPYKEQYRLPMIKWSEHVRREDSGYFCRAACEMAELKPIWIVSDIRRKTDIEWFKETYVGKIKTIRVNASLTTRQNRGWIFTSGIDDVASECGLDDYYNWDLQITNNNDGELDIGLQQILSILESL